MALAILLSHPEMILNAENNTKSQRAALFTSVPTIFKWWSINAAFASSKVGIISTTSNVQGERTAACGRSARP